MRVERGMKKRYDFVLVMIFLIFNGLTHFSNDQSVFILYQLRQVLLAENK